MQLKAFLDEHFLLNCPAAEILYHEYAAPMPILDYHCHIPVQEIADNRQFDNLTQIWLAGDHYKWRAMRTCGVDERLITGDAPDFEKFMAWAHTLPRTLCNPLFHWSHLELRRYFGINELLTPDTAQSIWDRANAMLRSDAGRVRTLISASNVQLLCTTDDPVDSLEHHARLAAAREGFAVRVLPAFRPDALFFADKPAVWNAWVDRLAQAASTPVTSWDTLLHALQQRHDFFHSMGCRTSDYGLEQPYAANWTTAGVHAAFTSLRKGAPLCGDELLSFRSALLFELMAMHGRAGWVQQLHLGVVRNTNNRAMQALGPNTGYDAMGDFDLARPLLRLLDSLERQHTLAKTILYSINPRDNHMLASVLGCFMDGKTAGKIQLGSAWWFNDQKEGMEKQLEALASIGLLGLFVGMLTDSRSFLSYPRHEYFRRLLCEKVGQEMQRGELPGDFALVGGMIQDICYNNAVHYFAMGPE